MDTNDTNVMIELFDKALNSNSTEVKSILQSLLVTTALVHADDKIPPGPLVKILDEVQAMRKAMMELNHHVVRLEQKINDVKSSIGVSSRKRVTSYDENYDYTDRWQDDKTWEESIKKMIKSRDMMKSLAEYKAKIKDNDESRYTSIKSTIAKFAAKLK